MTNFCKSEDCPSSQQLLAYQTGDLSRQKSAEIRRHLKSCEFCSAEVEFYSHYPQEEGFSETAAIPAPLFELAEALLKHRYTDSASLYDLLRENEELLVDNV
jgi:hypothetical protein